MWKDMLAADVWDVNYSFILFAENSLVFAWDTIYEDFLQMVGFYFTSDIISNSRWRFNFSRFYYFR